MHARVNIVSVTMPAGDYFVGDPCYAVPDARWMEWLQAADYEDEPTYLIADLDGQTVLGIGTAHGDGTYGGSDGHGYPVDAGLIGVVPVEIGNAAEMYERESNSIRGMQHVTFDRDFDCRYDDGKIAIGNIVIDTDPDEEVYNDEPEYDEDENEDGEDEE